MGETGRVRGRPNELILGGSWVGEFITGATSYPVRHHSISQSHVINMNPPALAGRPGLNYLEEENIIVDNDGFLKWCLL